MPSVNLHSPALTVALSIAIGTLAQALAMRMQVPALILLLAMGVAFGPEGLGLVQPSALGGALLILVGFAVAVILFEGGMNLSWRRVRREDRVILRLVTGGALITALGAALAARLCLGWSWPISTLFGTLVIVTGPTVVTPLLRRLRVEHSTATVLEAEGVLIDGVGAIIAASALEVVLAADAQGFVHAVSGAMLGLGLGALVGALAGVLLSTLLRFVPEELRNVLTLSLVLALFHVSNAVIAESGIVVVTVAGMVVGNRESPDVRELFSFKEQLTLMLIGMLFVLLAADVRLSAVWQLGNAGLWVVAALICVVRPLNVALSTYGSSLKLRQRLFIAWIAPRGIVAAAMASLFAVELERAGMPGGRELRALVFLVITATVLSAGLTGGLVGRLLGLRRASDVGWVIMGANELARVVAHALKHYGEDVVSIDTDPHYCSAAEESGLRVLHANGLEPRTLQRAYIDTRAGAIGLSQSTEANILFSERTKEEAKLSRRYVVVGRSRARYAVEAVRRNGGRIMFAQPADLDQWNVRLRRQAAAGQVWVWTGKATDKLDPHPLRNAPEELFIPLIAFNGKRAMPVSDVSELERDTEVIVLTNRDRATDLETWLATTSFKVVRAFDVGSDRLSVSQRTPVYVPERDRGREAV